MALLFPSGSLAGSPFVDALHAEGRRALALDFLAVNDRIFERMRLACRDQVIDRAQLANASAIDGFSLSRLCAHAINNSPLSPAALTQL
jgi:hypothetical protein